MDAATAARAGLALALATALLALLVVLTAGSDLEDPFWYLGQAAGFLAVGSVLLAAALPRGPVARGPLELGVAGYALVRAAGVALAPLGLVEGLDTMGRIVLFQGIAIVAHLALALVAWALLEAARARAAAPA